MEMKCPVTGNIIRKSVFSKSGSESKYLTEFEDLGFIAKFGFGIVKKCRNRLDDCIYAVKIVSLKSANIPFEKVLREVKALHRLRHPNVVRYHQAWLEENFSGVSYCSSDESLTEDSPLYIDFDSPCMFIQMEFCPRSLEKFLKTSGNLDGQKIWKLFCQIMEGLAKVHAAGVAHPDLSLANILLDAEDNIRISDFGLAELYNRQTKVDTKDDMFGLGLIFSILRKHLPTEHEASELLRNLKEKKDFPESWIYDEHEQLKKKVLSQFAAGNSLMQQQPQQFSSSSQGAEQDSLDLDKQEVQTLGDSEGKEPDVKKMRL
ncbi:uncharacterized protein LOC132271302 [Cornus florida]|uniref:uncharacterized protein LOC132271302 n=1 Tax=Cornus florida TaxID=4283 RepID=UPI0028984858|nr:uncharacterized protein LOC132271302 [Cornus florida]